MVSTSVSGSTATIRPRDAAQVPAERLVPALLSISKSIRALQGIKLAELGFHNGQDELLMVIGTEGDTVGVVADRLSIRPSTVSKMMDRLVAKGLVERIGDARDGRRTLIRITPSGIEAHGRLLRVRADLDADIASGLNAERCAEIASELETFAHHIACRLRRIR